MKPEQRKHFEFVRDEMHGDPEQMYIEMSKHLNCPHCGGSGHIDDVAQPEQEPVAWMRDDEMKAMVAIEKQAWIEGGRSELIEDYTIPLYTTTPQRKPLTDEQIDEAIDAWFGCEGKTWRVRMRAAIEAANGIKGQP